MGAGPIADALAGRVAEVEHVDTIAGLADTDAGWSGRWDLLVTLDDDAASPRVLREIVLSGGTTLVGRQGPERSLRTDLTAPGGPRRNGRRLVRAMGFSDLIATASYLVASSFGRPESLAPDSPQALAAYLSSREPPSRKRQARRAAVRLGWVPREFTGYLVAARRT